MDRWRGKVAVVTGASEGIGEAIVRRLASHGMKVAALARRQDLLEAIQEDVNKTAKNPGRVWARCCDVSDLEQVKEAFQWVSSNIGPVDVLVNNAAVFKYNPLHELDSEVAKNVIDVNLCGVFHCTQLCLESMREAKINDGHIININSVLGLRDLCFKGTAIYTASKHALTSFSGSLKRELAEEKMKTRVTNLCPGLVKTSMSSWFTNDHPEIPALASADITDAVVFSLAAPPHVNISEVVVDNV